MFESHITIAPIDKDEFLRLCDITRQHPIIIENDSSSDRPVQMMTRRFHKTDSLDQATKEMWADSLNLPSVIRRKVELILKQDCLLPEDYKYTETHYKFEIPEKLYLLFTSSVQAHYGHYSRNSLKDPSEWFATFRHKNGGNIFVSNMRQYEPSGLKLLSKIREVVMYDDNPELSSGFSPCMDCILKK